ncbi:MAG TPA: hypothetical protein VJY43_00760 [Methanocorpusculum sp.]|nr:hypothetical protein [Methanocorpusculum sp.]
MALKSLSEALGMLVKKPLVWMPGIFTAFGILFTYYVYTLFGIGAAFPVGVTLLVILPAFLAGTYGIIIGNKSTAGDFRKYAIYGYIRCLIPNLVIVMLGWLLSNALTYLLLIIGVSTEMAIYFSFFVIIPLVFFCYFADITAIVNNLPVFQAIKDSAVRVTSGSISSTAFYLFNVTIFFAMSFVFSGIWSLMASDALLPILEMGEAELLTLSETELLALFTAPEIISSGVISLAICAFIFVPLFVSYKACFFKQLLVNQPPQEAQTQHQGSYDAKGRWYKYS